MSKREPIIEQEEEEESSEFESEKIDSPHPSIIIESNMKENIYSEYNKNKNYYDKEEKNISEKINKDSYDKCPKNKFRKKTLLHDDEITSICALDGLTKQISYATSSLDNTIKFWTGKFKLIDTAGQENFRSLNNSYLKNAEGIFFIFSHNSKKSFENITYWIDSIKENKQENF